MADRTRYWLVKSEPEVFSIDDLRRSPNQATGWDGVRNYQARNYLRSMQLGDEVLFYHSNADPPAIVGMARVVRQAYPDPTQFDERDPHYDARSSPLNPPWDMVDLKFTKKFATPLALDVLRQKPGLKQMELLRRGSRLSVQPVRKSEWELILRLADR